MHVRTHVLGIVALRQSEQRQIAQSRDGNSLQLRQRVRLRQNQHRLQAAQFGPLKSGNFFRDGNAEADRKVEASFAGKLIDFSRRKVRQFGVRTPKSGERPLHPGARDAIGLIEPVRAQLALAGMVPFFSQPASRPAVTGADPGKTAERLTLGRRPRW